MFKLNRHRPGKAGDNIEFKFSHLQVSQDMNLSASGSHRSSDSGESFIGRTKLSPMNSQSGAYSQILRQDSSGSQCSSACAATEDASRSTSSLLNSKGAGPNRWQDRNGDPSKELLEAAQETIEELRGEARLWERNARKLKADLEALRKESSDQSRHQEDVEMGLKDAHMEIDNLKSEIERLRSSMKDFQATEAVSRSKFLQEGQIHRQKELEDELRFHKESNASLSLQLKKTQESNLELVSILQELEDTIEKQRLEITSFSEGTFGRKRSSEDEHMVDLAKKSPDFEDPRGTSQGSGSGNAPDLTREINTLKAKIQELERECTELTEENLGLMIKMKEPKKDIVKNEISLGCTPQIFLGKFSSSDPGSDIFQYMTKVHQAAEVNPLSSYSKTLRRNVLILRLNCRNLKTQLPISAQNYVRVKRRQNCQCKDMFQGGNLEIGQKNKRDSELNTSMDSHILAKKLLERKSQELEKGKHELELHITELEKENVGLSERISGLEAQLRYLTNAKESSRLELENSRHLVMNLRDEIQTLGTDMEKEKEELHQKLQAAQGRLTEAVEETEYLKRSHSKLQVTVESLIEECSSLQRLTSDLKKVQLNESEKRMPISVINLRYLRRNFQCCRKTLVLRKDHSFLKWNLKRSELENLKREIAHLTAQLSLNHNEDETVTSDGIEVSELRADKVKLENSLQEIQSKAKSYEMQIQSIRQEFGSNTQSLIGLLNASKESEDMLMADIGHMKRQMEKMKSEEEKVKKLANELELKLKSSEYEKQQLLEEVSNLKVQLTKITQLQDEVTVLKGSLDEEKFKKTKLEQSLHVISEECEKLKAENSSCKEKISTMQKALFGLEGDRRTRVALEEKLLRLECDLNAKEALHAQEMELKNELSRMKRSNSQYQRKMQCIEEERDELTRKVQVLEKDLRSNKTESEDGERLPAVADKSLPHNMERSQSVNMDDLQAKIIPLQTELAEALETNNVYKEQLKRLLAEKEANAENASKNSAAEAAQVGGRDDRLETELKEMRERYLQMSLRYAEVEAQREDLVMKLKSTKKEKRWFS
ncbi:unnamed protein product [Spirodela intermedia]|uniref:Uncharacterized protein n=1 Tax=Spirodela intermedia TaxID=51605 RepID=A0A7I8ID78_SPIIN|nr:unnamed protein product [Spirodela intermedia]CAA6655571.1 unnamed protein product [Spirodela intermedia]